MPQREINPDECRLSAMPAREARGPAREVRQGAAVLRLFDLSQLQFYHEPFAETQRTGRARVRRRSQSGPGKRRDPWIKRSINFSHILKSKETIRPIRS